MRISTLAVVAGASLVCATALPAVAQDSLGACVRTTRDDGNNNIVKVRTVVENKDDNREYEVRIYDDADLLEEGTIARGEKLISNDSGKPSNKSKYHMRIVVKPVNGQGVTSCFYNVTAKSICSDAGCYADTTWRYWSLYDEACPGTVYTVTCQKTWKRNQDRWVTTLAIEGR